MQPHTFFINKYITIIRSITMWITPYTDICAYEGFKL